MNESGRWQFMLDLQGSNAEKLRWLASHVGRLYEIIESLKKDVAGLKASRTKAKKRKVRK